MALFQKEFFISLKSLTYWLVVLLIGFFLFSQLGTDLTSIKEPQPHEDDYGVSATTDKKSIQKQTIGNLFYQHGIGEYNTYPFGFLKVVTSSNHDQKEIGKIIERATGKSLEELSEIFEKEMDELQIYAHQNFDYFPIAKDYSYQLFQKDMRKVSEIIGKSSDFEEANYKSSAIKPLSYEEAHEKFEMILKKDHVSGAYARLVCDYLGIILALVPVFLAATVVLRDKRAESQLVIYTKAVSSIKLQTMRFLSTVVLIFIPVLLFSIMPALQANLIAQKFNQSGDIWLFYQYILGWTLPTIIAVVGISFLITTLFGGIASVVAQIAIWFISVSAGSLNIVGKVGFNLIPRFNHVGSTVIFEGIVEELVINRILWASIGILCFLISVFVYDYKRNGGKIFGKGN
ncbi:ABC transporter permease [Bacillus norwichensis]|uniref:ABC transporter permease n=1 Tax=Bacillus norwichensis TaxID=2762217 RepID=A0ABR8VQ80_9BACI|nr:ABC transporter permease [Bacillus norwichensis]MBD8006903.1 ABC transporter permease [Bacillus norwichensis]